MREECREISWDQRVRLCQAEFWADSQHAYVIVHERLKYLYRKPIGIFEKLYYSQTIERTRFLT